jgi:hypothetical protein
MKDVKSKPWSFLLMSFMSLLSDRLLAFLFVFFVIFVAHHFFFSISSNS